MNNFWMSMFNRSSSGTLELVNKVAAEITTQDDIEQTTETGLALSYEELQNLSSNFSFNDAERQANYGFYDHVDNNYAICSSALDLHADDAIQLDFYKGKPFWIECEDEEVVRLGEAILYDTLGLEEIRTSWSVIRDFCKYGDAFEEIIVDKTLGIVKVIGLPPQTMFVNVNPQLEIMNYKQEIMGSATIARKGIPFNPWQISHLKIPGRNRHSIYGRSIFADAVRSLKMLEAIETSLLLQRLVRGTDRYLVNIPVDNLSDEKAQERVKQVAHTLRRKKFIDVKKGEFQSVLNAVGTTQDFFIPTREKGSISIDLLPTSNVQQHIDDVEYFQKKAVAALKIPPEFLSYLSEGQDRSKKLVNTDIRWARKIRRIQGIYRDHLDRIVRTHLMYILKREVPDYKILFASVSALEEQAKLEALEIRASVAAALQDYFPIKTILIDIFKLSDEEADKYLNQMDVQHIDKTVVDAVAQGSADKVNQEYLQGSTEEVPPETGEEPSKEEPPKEEFPKESRNLSESTVLKMFKEQVQTNRRLQEAVTSLHEIVRKKRLLERKNGNS